MTPDELREMYKTGFLDMEDLSPLFAEIDRLRAAHARLVDAARVFNDLDVAGMRKMLAAEDDSEGCCCKLSKFAVYELVAAIDALLEAMKGEQA
jgi:hypothetical protein